MNHHLARAVADWQWFLRDASAAMGIHAVDYLQMSMSMGSTQRNSDHHTTQQLNAARRHARIERALLSMRSDHVSLIRLACDEPPRALRAPFGQLGNLAHLSRAAQEGHRASRSTRDVGAWLDRFAFKLAQGRAVSGPIDASCIALSCEDVLGPARDAYVSALGRIP